MRFLAVVTALVFAPLAVGAQVIDQGSVDAIKAASSEDWEVAYSITDTTDKVTNDLITWMRLLDGRCAIRGLRRFHSATQ